MRREAQRSQKVTLQTAPKARRLCREVWTSIQISPQPHHPHPCFCANLPWILKLHSLKHKMAFKKQEKVSTFLFFICLSLKTLWNSLTFCKTTCTCRSVHVTNNEDLALGNWFQRRKLTIQLLCTCRCHTDVKFWCVLHSIFSWNVLIIKSRTVNASKTFIFISHQMLLYWKKYEKVEKEHRKRAEKEAMEQRKLDDEFREVRILKVCWLVDWWMYCWCLNFKVHRLTEVFFSLMHLCTLRSIEESLVEGDRVLHVS